MSDKEFIAFMDLLMCSDPWPVVSEQDSQDVLIELAESEARKRGYRDWISAHHYFSR